MKNYKKGFIVPLIIAIVTVLVIGGGAYIYKTQKVEAPVVNTNSATSTLVGNDRDAHGCIGSAGYSWCAEKSKCLRVWEEKCEATTSTNVTTSLKKYSNSDWGIEFEYPNDWKLGQLGSEISLESPDFEYLNAELDSRVLKGSLITINYPRLEAIVSVENYVNSIEGVSEKINLKIDSIDAIGYYYGSGNQAKLFVNFIKNGYLYQIIFKSVGEEKKDRDYPVLNQILSTFKFTK